MMRGSRRIATVEIGNEDITWMGIGFGGAVCLLAMAWLLLRCYKTCKCRRRSVPNKIRTPRTTPDLAADETRSESDDGGEGSGASRLANFFQSQQPVNDATSDVSQSDVWSFSLKSFAEQGAFTMHEAEYTQSEASEDDTLDESLYTTVGPISPHPPSPVAVERPVIGSRRFVTAVEI